MLGRGRWTAAIVATAALAAISWGAVPAPADPAASKSVAGGRLASIAEYPYTAVVLKDGKFHCTGTVISPTRVLTAGHCLKPDPVRLGVLTGTDRARFDPSAIAGQLSLVDGAIRHPGYSEERRDRMIYNDIGIIFLRSATTAPPIPLPTPGQDAPLVAPGAPVTVAGFGERNPVLIGKTRIGRLASGEMKVRGNCDRLIGGFSAETMICAQGRRLGVARSGRKRRSVHRSGCFGDSGGPLIGQTGTGPTALGITSGGEASPKSFFFVLCGLRGKPGMYTRVAPYVPWIQANL